MDLLCCRWLHDAATYKKAPRAFMHNNQCEKGPTLFQEKTWEFSRARWPLEIGRDRAPQTNESEAQAAFGS
jgi:hypothetical protein